MKALAVLTALLASAGCDRRQETAPEATSAAPAPSRTADPPDDGAGGGPTNRFIVCPGNPRCPKAGESEPPEDVD
jgi:hypothetical protein